MVDRTIIKQIHPISVEQTAVGTGQHATTVYALTMGQGSFEIEPPQEAILGNTHRKLDKDRCFQKLGKRTGQATLTRPDTRSNHNPAQIGVYCEQEESLPRHIQPNQG
jgi:hypothetical protein